MGRMKERIKSNTSWDYVTGERVVKDRDNNTKWSKRLPIGIQIILNEVE